MLKKWFKGMSVLNTIAILVALVAPIIAVQRAQASNLTLATMRIDRMAASTPTTGTVCVKPTAPAGTENKVVLTFPNSFTVGLTATWTIDNTYTAAWPSGATAWAVTSPNAVPASKTVTFTSPDLSVGTTYCFNWNLTTALSTGSTTGALDASIETQDSGSATIDKSAVKLYVLTTSDQVTITGTVNPTFTAALSATSANFTTIANSVADVTTAPTYTVTTNARNGWTAWVKDANNGTLTSAGTGSNIPIPQAVGLPSIDLGTKTATGAFGLGVTVSGGSATADAAYNGATAGFAGTLSNNFRIAAYSTTFATSDVVTLRPRAIASVTQAPAADYTDTLTIVAAGQF